VINTHWFSCLYLTSRDSTYTLWALLSLAISSWLIALAVLTASPVESGLYHLSKKNLLEQPELVLQPPLVQPDELLAEVQIWSIWAVEYSKTALTGDFFNDALGSMDCSIVI
jgi:hypothetical protein